jgi:hypothetical protein
MIGFQSEANSFSPALVPGSFIERPRVASAHTSEAQQVARTSNVIRGTIGVLNNPDFAFASARYYGGQAAHLGCSRSRRHRVLVRPTRIERRARLVNAIARGRRWLDEIVSGSVTDVQQIAARQKCSVRQVNMTISLAFLAPDLVRAAVEGRLPRGLGSSDFAIRQRSGADSLKPSD